MSGRADRERQEHGPDPDVPTEHEPDHHDRAFEDGAHDPQTMAARGDRGHDVASDADPANARMVNHVDYRLDQDGRRIAVRAGGETTSTETDFRMTVQLEVDLDGQPFFRRDWDETIPRRLV